MTPSFSSAIDPIFLHVLGVLDKIGRNERLTPESERTAILNWLREAESQVGQKQEWDLAKYALVAWIDDMMIEAPWEGRDWWRENALEVELFKTRDRATQFFVRAQEAANMTRRDALEVFYVCVVLGFRGLYRDHQAALLANQYRLPMDLESWAQQTSRSIQLGQGRPPINEDPRPASSAPPLDGKFQFLGSVVMSIVLCVLAALLALFLYFRTPTP